MYNKFVCRNYLKRQNYDTINFEFFYETTRWVLEDKPPSLLAEELEIFQYKLASCTVQDNQITMFNLLHEMQNKLIVVHSFYFY